MTSSHSTTQLGTGLEVDRRVGHDSPSNPDRDFQRITSLPRRSYAPFFSLFATLLLAVSGSVEAGTIINAGGAKLSDVTAAVKAAQDGDTVVLPVGTETWTSTLAINKAITLQGAGVGNTIIIDNVPRSGQAATQAIVWWSLVAGKPSRMTGIEFQNAASSASTTGAILIWGNNTGGQTLRIDNCKFNLLKAFSIQTENVIGVIDHNTFTLNGIGIYVFNRGWNGGSYGDGAWTDATNWGSSKFLFVEDNAFTFPTGSMFAAIDAYAGARYVFRHNTITRGWCEAHGTESSNIYRGTRAIEVYNNTFDAVNGAAGGGNGTTNYLVNLRSGTALVHDNTWSNYAQTPVIHLACHRTLAAFIPWYLGATVPSPNNLAADANGTNVWDVNVPGGPFYSGIASSGGTLTVTVTGAGWTTNQWAGYSITKTTSGAASKQFLFSEIESNTNDTITYLGSGGYAPVYNYNPPNLTFISGDNFQIWKVDRALDQPGRSGGSLLIRNPSTGYPTPPTGWNNQIADPVYQWNNGSGVVCSAGGKVIRRNLDYFDNTQAPNYTPYTYPHPLVSGAGPNPTPSATPAPSLTPSAPKNLRITKP